MVFDKTGTLTEPLLALAGCRDADALREAAALAACSRHPAGPVAGRRGRAGRAGFGRDRASRTRGCSRMTEAGEIRLGSRAFCGGSDGAAAGPELWLSRPGLAPVRFGFDERLRADAVETVDRLRAMGLKLALLSGDRPAQVERIAAALGIGDWRAGCSPVDKVALIEAMGADGGNVLMVGDGLNDSPALAAASVSASPATAADVSQTVADLVFQGAKLAPVALALKTARRSRSVMRQNLALSIGYNVLMVPLAVCGWVTPWLAAAAMSGSSLLVMANSLRLHGRTDA